jgi:sirohydrochlorin cobaltochelatase
MQGIILFAHGSRDPLWHRPIQAVAQRMAALAPEVPTRCAYLELTTPTLAEAAAELVGLGVQDLTVVPLFLGVGKHAREDLPLLLDELRQNHPQVRIDCQPSVGEQAAVVDCLAQIALGRAPQNNA